MVICSFQFSFCNQPVITATNNAYNILYYRFLLDQFYKNILQEIPKCHSFPPTPWYGLQCATPRNAPTRGSSPWNGSATWLVHVVHKCFWCRSYTLIHVKFEPSFNHDDDRCLYLIIILSLFDNIDAPIVMIMVPLFGDNDVPIFFIMMPLFDNNNAPIWWQ